MQSQQTTKLDTMSTGARYLASEILREPVKDAVKEALREEADIRAQETESRHRMESDSGQSAREGSDESSGLPVGLLVAGLTAATGIAYLARKRSSEPEQSTWSEFDEESTAGAGHTEPTGPTSESGSSTTD